MSKGPGLFSDIGKKAKDLLTKDYSSDQKLTVSSYSGAGVALTSTAVKKGGLSTGDIAALYKYKNTIIDVKLDTASIVGYFVFLDYNSAGYDTTSGGFTKYTAGISVSKPDSSASIILGDKGDSIKASYLHHLDQFKKSAAVAEITRRFSTNENTFTVGGSFAIDHLTQVKARLNNHGKLGALLQHEVIPKSVLTISGEVDTKALDKNPRFGLAIALKP
ncbi:mitochondrial outer membrane protein porin 2 isoform X2 [Gastrolobium bilobum]|uniref:mitochondrial outer membrane protein porin 2 isoform X2 n=1 Tax=Gastrolobium bilobum TaxID=150636 RepID=UPI002AB15855|nr:mitochondrial outer membrane protein porin 2 isoform X2 [Gastrolobium bilobum]